MKKHKNLLSTPMNDLIDETKAKIIAYLPSNYNMLLAAKNQILDHKQRAWDNEAPYGNGIPATPDKTIGEILGIKKSTREPSIFFPWEGKLDPSKRVKTGEFSTKSHFRAKLHIIDGMDIWVFEAINSFVIPPMHWYEEYECIGIKNHPELTAYKKDNRLWILNWM